MNKEDFYNEVDRIFPNIKVWMNTKETLYELAERHSIDKKGDIVHADLGDRFNVKSFDKEKDV